MTMPLQLNIDPKVCGPCGCKPGHICSPGCFTFMPNLCATCVITADPLDLVAFFFGEAAVQVALAAMAKGGHSVWMTVTRCPRAARASAACGSWGNRPRTPGVPGSRAPDALGADAC